MSDPPLWPSFIPSLLLGLVALLLTYLPGDGGAPTVAAGAFVEPQIHQALAQQPTARVLVTLHTPPALRATPLDLAAVRSQVATAQAQVLAAQTPTGFSPTYVYQAVPALAGRISKEGLAALSRHPTVAAVMIDGWGVAATSQSASIIHADEAHNAGLTGAGVTVAVLDSGIDTDHTDLMDDVLYEACFLTVGDCPEAHPGEDDFGHGTNVTGIVTSAGAVAPRGIAPDAKIAVYKVLNSAGIGLFSDWIAALDDIIANHPEVDIVNMSLQSSSSCPAGPMTTAIATLRSQGVPTFIAAGNHGAKNSLTVPACIAEALSVGATYDGDIGSVNGWKTDCADATTSADQVACWSDSDRTLDLLAPGAAITSTGRGGGASTFFGTSQAAPHAAGVAALLLQAFPDLTVDELEARLESTGTPVTDDLHDSNPATNRTTPRIDARVALLADGEDTDGDGCSNAEEYGPDPRLGGRRNPLNPWDFNDVNGDGVITLFDDILAVIHAFGPAGGATYDPALDRSPAPPASDPWIQGPPDGTIDIANDILGIAAQFGHRCAGPT